MVDGLETRKPRLAAGFLVHVEVDDDAFGRLGTGGGRDHEECGAGGCAFGVRFYQKPGFVPPIDALQLEGEVHAEEAVCQREAGRAVFREGDFDGAGGVKLPREIGGQQVLAADGKELVLRFLLELGVVHRERDAGAGRHGATGEQGEADEGCHEGKWAHGVTPVRDSVFVYYISLNDKVF